MGAPGDADGDPPWASTGRELVTVTCRPTTSTRGSVPGLAAPAGRAGAVEAFSRMKATAPGLARSASAARAAAAWSANRSRVTLLSTGLSWPAKLTVR